MRIEKMFEGTHGVRCSLCAIVCEHGIVIDLIPTGGTASFDTAEASAQARRDEGARIVKWARNAFIGCPEQKFTNHSGRVPYERVVGMPPALGAGFKMGALPDPYQEFANEFLGAVYQSAWQQFLRENGLAPSPVEFYFTSGVVDPIKLDQRDRRFAVVEGLPKIGSRWRDRARPVRVFRVVELIENATTWTVVSEREERGGIYSFSFRHAHEWLAQFEELPPAESPEHTAHQGAVDVEVPAEEIAERVAMRDLKRVATPVDAFANVLDGVPFVGKELPPKVGEVYFDVSGERWGVCSVSAGNVVLMKSHGPKARGACLRFVFANHEQWLSSFRPVDDEGNARTVEVVNVANPADLVTAMLADAVVPYEPEGFDKVAAELEDTASDVEYTINEDRAVHDLTRVFDELSRRLPGWNAKPTSGPELSETDLMIRAIRTLARCGDARYKTAVAQRDTALQQHADLGAVNRNLYAKLEEVVVRHQEACEQRDNYKRQLRLAQTEISAAGEARLCTDAALRLLKKLKPFVPTDALLDAVKFSGATRLHEMGLSHVPKLLDAVSEIIVSELRSGQ